MYNKIMESVSYINEKVKRNPKIAIILGSGLGDLVNVVEDMENISYEEIPNFPVSTVKGHEGKLAFRKINGVEVLLMQGRFHYYEGYNMKEVTYPIYVMKQLGIEKIIVTNACGGINTNFEPGTLMIINDFINLFGTNPLIGVNDERLGTRFPDMSEPYKIELMNKAKKVADELGIKYDEGVYAGFMGPYYETAAEVRMIGKHGADAVGMSTVPETIVANYLGMDVLGIACITNMATGIQKVKHSHERVVETAQKASANLCKWVSKVIEVI
ncbi:purine-nucleoside phosphorylase [Clostridium botulinum]|nr:purine-nucleoside phosphorylase [Clostridium botulinum]